MRRYQQQLATSCWSKLAPKCLLAHAPHALTPCRCLGLRQLRAQRERVDVLVDQVVQDYHAGFNKSIHNYSQILVLFTQAKEQARIPARRALPRGPACLRTCLFGKAQNRHIFVSRALA